MLERPRITILDHHRTGSPTERRASGERGLIPGLSLPRRVSKLTQDALGRGRDSADVLPSRSAPSRTNPYQAE
jgi:hypothetical protein